MQVPRRFVEEYSRGLNSVSEQGRAALREALMAVDWSQDVAAVREQLVAIMQRCCGASSTVAARLAAEFYDGLREWCGLAGDGFAAEVAPMRDPGATDGFVRAAVQGLVDGDGADAVADRLLDRLDQEVRQSANRCVEANAKRDPKKPKWARVPTGAETCSFCVMLASRGFKYHTKELASHAHAHCDCRVVPGWDGYTSVEGYDPKYYEDCYAHPDEHPEIRDAINARRRELRAQRKEAASGQSAD